MEIINDNGVEKLCHEGEIAVLFSPGWGAGWSTWADDKYNEEHVRKMLFDPVLAQCIVEYTSRIRVLSGGRKSFPGSDAIYAAMQAELERIAEERYPDEYHGGLESLQIAWLKRGTQFRIDEYDGNESIDICEQVDWEVA